MEKPATDIYAFEDLRRKGFSYVDKTAQSESAQFAAVKALHAGDIEKFVRAEG